VCSSDLLTSLLGALWGGVLLNRLTPSSQALNGQQVNGAVSQVLVVLSEVFLPLYFISVGMRVQMSTLLEPQAWLLALVLLFTTAPVAASMLSRAAHANRVPMGPDATLDELGDHLGD